MQSAGNTKLWQYDRCVRARVCSPHPAVGPSVLKARPLVRHQGFRRLCCLGEPHENSRSCFLQAARLRSLSRGFTLLKMLLSQGSKLQSLPKLSFCSLTLTHWLIFLAWPWTLLITVDFSVVMWSAGSALVAVTLTLPVRPWLMFLLLPDKMYTEHVN